MKKNIQPKRQQDLVSLCLKFHEKFYGAVNKLDDFVFTATRTEHQMMFKFIELVNSQYGLRNVDELWFFNYVESNWNYYFDKKGMKFGKMSIQLNWIFGEKAFIRYVQIKEIDDNYFSKCRKINIDLGLNIFPTITDLKGKNFYDLNIRSAVFSEDIERRRFHNTPEGFYWCSSNTSLYNHKSSFCAVCRFNQDCKKRLKQSSPNVFKSRGYNYE